MMRSNNERQRILDDEAEQIIKRNIGNLRSSISRISCRLEGLQGQAISQFYKDCISDVQDMLSTFVEELQAGGF